MRAPQLTPASRILVAGHRGLAGSALCRRLRAAGHENLVLATSSEVDLRDRAAAGAWLAEHRPDVVVLAAERGGRGGAGGPADVLSDNLRIQTSVLDAARVVAVPRLLFLASACLYPRESRQPIRESSLMSGPLEPATEFYAIAKIAGLAQVRAVREQDGLAWISALPTNLYGPGDDFHAPHGLAGLMRAVHEAAQIGAPSVTVPGSGTPRREFLHVDDLAEACVALLEQYDDPTPVNIGTGRDISTADLAKMLAETIGYTGAIEFDPAAPDGAPRRVLDIRTMTGLGWEPRTRLRAGIAATYEWYLDNTALPRQREAVRGHEMVG
ncbi:GDP-L-fucose synthase [Actinokineospora baliensis]|uniref:GDP-L-fucose synthase family protein n=1 Tax=Actinokineospora baliensis TaxID=547056 RepID=UPI001EF968AF|nr:GDP-L-fucose synthase [Actinokineospora baliensis]MBM7773515.1 GDP-L-fucose synthase [Actinokineospora baliensis]